MIRSIRNKSRTPYLKSAVKPPIIMMLSWIAMDAWRSRPIEGFFIVSCFRIQRLVSYSERPSKLYRSAEKPFPLAKFPNFRHLLSLNSAMIALVYCPPIIYAASNVDAAE